MAIDRMVQKPIATHHCKACGHVLSRQTNFVGVQQVKPGDIHFCVHCGHVSFFDDNLEPRELTEAELAELMRGPQAAELCAAQRAVRMRGGA